MSVADALNAVLASDLVDMGRWAVQAHRQALERTRRLAVLGEKVLTKGEALASSSGGITVDAVRATIASGGTLSARERRFVVMHWPEFRSGVLTVIGDDVSLGLLLRRAVFQRFREVKQEFELLNHISELEQQTGNLLGDVPLRSWKTPGAIGARMAQSPPALWDEQLVAMGLRPSWDYAVMARTEAFSQWLKAQPSVGGALRSIQSDPMTSTRYLPPREVRSQSERFWVTGWEHIIGAWLDAAARQPGEAAAVDTMVLDSELRDPLSSQAHHVRWTTLRHSHPTGYAALLTRLSKTDIEFFFQEAQGNDARERGRYWLRFLHSVRQTTSFLSRHDRDAAHAQLLRAPNPHHGLALKRAGFVGGDASVFVLWFDAIVVVEFSKTGNATYVYSRKDFEQLRSVWTSKSAPGGAFKNKHLALTTLSHHSGWQYNFDKELKTHGILPAPPRHPQGDR